MIRVEQSARIWQLHIHTPRQHSACIYYTFMNTKHLEMVPLWKCECCLRDGIGLREETWCMHPCPGINNSRSNNNNIMSLIIVIILWMGHGPDDPGSVRVRAGIFFFTASRPDVKHSVGTGVLSTGCRGRAAGEWSYHLTSIRCTGQEWVELYLHYPP
jgi:hypothetical protein